MELIIINDQWCRGIFKHMVMHPELAEELHFRADYLSLNQNSNLPKLYRAICDLRKNYNMDFSKEALELAMFTKVHPEFETCYFNQSMVDDVVVKQMRTFKEAISSFYDNIEMIYNSLGPEFIEEKARELVIQEATRRRLHNSYEMYNNMCIDNTAQDTFEFHDSFLDQMEKINNEYQYPEQNSNVYILNNIDSHFRVRISDKIYATASPMLNSYLSGGFHKQTMTGFLTKTGGGKTTLLCTLAADALLRQQNVCFVNLEMNDHEVSNNIYSSVLQNRSYNEIKDNIDNNEYAEKLVSEMASMNIGMCGFFSNQMNGDKPNRRDLKYDVDWLDNNVKHNERIIASQTNNPDFRFDLVFIDYLYLMRPKHILKSARSDEMYRQLVIEVHKWAQDNNYSVITVFQGNRTAESKLNNNEDITLADAGDSYAAFRDLEYAFAVSRYNDYANNYDGIALTPLKTRHYDGEYNSFYVPYMRGYRRYDMAMNQVISLSKDVKNAESEKIDITELLDKHPELRDIPCGFINVVCAESKKVKHYDYNSIKSEFKRRGWPVLLLKDIPDGNSDEVKQKLREQVEQAIRSVLNNATDTKYNVVLSDDPNELFS